MSKTTDLMKKLYTGINIVIQINDKICGGIPKAKDLIRKWQEAVGGTPPQAEQIIEDMGDIEETVEACSTGFKCDPDHGLYIEERNVKALLKECACVLGITSTKKGSKQILQHGLYTRPERLYMGVAEPSGVEEAICCVSGPQGKRTAIKRFDYVLRPRFEFRIDLLNRIDEKQPFDVDSLHLALVMGQDNGLGTNRSQGYGKYTLEKFEVVK